MAPAQEKARFDAQLPKAQKMFFERAAKVGGFRTLTDFVLSSAQEKAAEIIARHETLLASDRDRQVFFDALLDPPEPIEKLRRAAERYDEATST